MLKSDVLIIGSGMASLQLAKLLSRDLHVIILTKSKQNDSNSYLAQGGIAASISPQDNDDKHALDTLEAGRFHNNKQAVEEMTKHAAVLIYELANNGCLFDRNKDGRLLLGMEGAHSESRIVHGGGDATGKTVVEFLSKQLTDNITIVEDFFVDELLLNDKNECIGAKGLNAQNEKEAYFATHTVIAAGGCGQIYEYTSSAETVTGDGIALAYLAGAKVYDMEFMQFHPTLLSVGGKTVGLVSEAVRGEGAVLITEAGERIMKHIHPYEDLAPRHIVSQTIYSYLKKGEKIYLDSSPVENFEKRFPSITKMCKDHQINLAEKKLPVAPGSHFLMGGIAASLDGRTSIKGLYAIGESACTGFHGANRLASNSLLEGLYMGKELANLINRNKETKRSWRIKEGVLPSMPIYLPEKRELKRKMMEHVGIVRNEASLVNQLEWIKSFGIKDYRMVQKGNYSKQEKETAFMLLVSWLITKSALERTESRGGHFRKDYPFEQTEWQNRLIMQQLERNEQNEQVKTQKTAGILFY
ncbi:L-aspartate oxidase [Niallia nealsonii]|uniref:L-aspartate oxidase n=1 Tax=Niallia nealsonii TaxID=115979 RepID=A0A2N0Z307_9BACI|nr:L-aspartate oxidase [Niallia nealsonii]PKG23903.1 L-aspartate oxidase [Niallia nealsonii]